MKLATFSTPGDAPEIGLVVDDTIKPVSRLLPRLPKSMTDLIAIWPEVRSDVASLASSRIGLPLSKVTLHAPVPRPGKVLAIGLNYHEHVEESRTSAPENQLWFGKQSTSVTGPFGDVDIPHSSSMVDYEVELVLVIGKRGRHIERSAAPDHVFGYAVGNDFSARDWQAASPQWMLGKSFDTHAPFGPWITTADEVGDPHRLRIRCEVNGDTRQDANTGHLIFDLWDQISHLSKVMTLEPGDVIFTGTPGGIGAAMSPPRFLEVGDVVRCDIEGLGAIENRMVAERVDR